MEGYFCRSLSETPFEENEAKKFEFCRYGSFKNWPCECPVYPSRLAKAGFFATGNGDEVTCYVCGTKKSDWKEGDDPRAIHRELSENCQFLSETYEENVPISMSQVTGDEASHDQRLSDLESLLEGPGGSQGLTISEEGVSPGILLVSGEAVNRDSGIENDGSLNENSNRLCSLNSTNTADSLAEVASGISDIKIQGPSVSGQNQVKNDSNQKEAQGQRGMTRSRSSDSALSAASSSSGAASSSSSGSDASRANSQVTSAKNGSSRKNPGMDIPPPTGAAIGPLRFERNRLATFKKWPSGAKVSATDLAKCGFAYTGSGDRVQCVFCKGILRNWEEGDRPHIEHRKHFPRCPLVLGIDSGNVPLPLGQTPRQYTSSQQGGSSTALNVAEGGTNMQSLGITTDRPKHAHFAIESQRVASFQNWPAYKHQTPQQLAEAGFFYAGFSDNVKCFYCNGGLRNWEKGDEPWHEHARWFQKCPFVLMVKGQDYINAINAERSEDAPILAQSGPNAEGSTIAEPPVRHEVEEREVKARMDRPHVKVVEEMGVSRDLIMTVIRKRLLEKGDDFPSATTLLEAVLLLEEQRARGQSESSSETTGTQLTDQDYNEADRSDQEAEDQKENEKTKSKPDEDDKSGGSEMKRSSSMPNQIDLQKENIELKEQRLCKICMVSDANVVFLPCGHLVSCASCAPALQLCPICRAVIKGTVRTYLS